MMAVSDNAFACRRAMQLTIRAGGESKVKIRDEYNAFSHFIGS